ncbi:MAG: hypothetical protein OXR03_10010 [Rhodospirillaceae bacterium]|nr:hypothetical protein [Rhodospirillaceae bacterium]
MTDTHNHEPIYDRLNEQGTRITRLEEQRTADLEWRNERLKAVDLTDARLERRIARIEMAWIATGCAGLYALIKLLGSHLGIDL